MTKAREHKIDYDIRVKMDGIFFISTGDLIQRAMIRKRDQVLEKEFVETMNSIVADTKTADSLAAAMVTAENSKYGSKAYALKAKMTRAANVKKEMDELTERITLIESEATYKLDERQALEYGMQFIHETQKEL